MGFILSHNIASLTYRSVTVEHGLCKVDPKHVPLLPAQERSASLTAITAIDKEHVRADVGWKQQESCHCR